MDKMSSNKEDLKSPKPEQDETSFIEYVPTEDAMKMIHH